MRISGGFVSRFRSSEALNSSRSELRLSAGPTIVLVLLLSACALADDGADIYKTRCSACHGSNGAGDTMLGKNMKLRSLASAEVQQESDGELAHIIGKGKERMPAYDRKLSKEQIDCVVKYIRSLKK